MRTFIGGQAIAIMTGVRMATALVALVAEDGLEHARACGHALSEAPGDTTVSLGVGPSPCAWGPPSPSSSFWPLATGPEMVVQDEELAGGHFEAMGATASISHSLLYNMRGFKGAIITTTTTIPDMNGRRAQPTGPPTHSGSRDTPRSGAHTGTGRGGTARRHHTSCGLRMAPGHADMGGSTLAASSRSSGGS